MTSANHGKGCLHEFNKGHAARLGGSRSRKCRWVEHIEVYGEIYGTILDLCDYFGESCKCKRAKVCMTLACPLPLRTLSAANAELMNASVAKEIPDTADYRRMGEVIAEIFVSEIRMRIEMNHGKIGVFFRRRLDRRQTHKMFTANQKGKPSVRQNILRKCMDHIQRTLCVSEWELQIAAVKRVCILKIKILIGAIRLQSVGLCPHGTCGEPRARAIGCRRVERRAKDDNMTVLVCSVASEKRFNVAVPHLRVSPPHSSAGQMQLRAAVCCNSVSLY